MTENLPFIRTDLNQFQAYKPHPGGEFGSPVQSPISLDRLDTNECPYDLPEFLKRKLAWVYQHEIETNRYPDGKHETLKAAVAEYVNVNCLEESANVQPRNISIGNGSDELIRSILIATCLSGEGSVLVANPTFSMYAILAETLGIPVIQINRSEADFSMDLKAAQQAIEQTQTPPIRVVFVVHPNSPTANILTQAELNWLKNLPEQILVVIDEAYFEFSQTTLVEELQHHRNWIILRTFSKAFRLAALRIGYAIAHPDLIAILEKVRLPYNLPAFSQLAAEFALSHQAELLSIIPEILAQRQQLSEALKQHSKLRVWPSHSNFLYTRLEADHLDRLEMSADEASEHRTLEYKTLEHRTLVQLRQTLQAQGTLIRHTGGGLRITIGTPAENQRTLKRLFN
ncbi:MAG: histidinol-phosphate transaminase [Microcoleaceae cyanobacterium]